MSGKSNIKYACLRCEHSERIATTKDDYQEVFVCPKCRGALVDVWLINKYLPRDTTKVELEPLIPKRILTVNEVREHYGLPKIPIGNEIYIKP